MAFAYQRLLYTLTGHSDLVYSIAINGQILASGSKDNTIKIWHIGTGKLLRTLNEDSTRFMPLTSVQMVAFS